MAFENLFIRTKKYIGEIQLDSVVTEEHQSPITLTKNPVELGANITDHAIIEPKTLQMQAAISDTPLGLAAFGLIVDTVSGLFGTSTSGNETRSRLAYAALIQLQETREVVEIQTGLKLYQNMIITNVAVIQDKDTSRMLDLTIDAEEVIISSSETVALAQDDLADGSPQDQASSAEKKGRVKPVTPEMGTNKTALKSITDWISGP